MTRFEKELSGALGEYWKKEAERELDNIRKDLDEGRITIDEFGALQNDMLEKVMMVSYRVNAEATRKECEKEALAAIEAYRANYKEPDQEELFELRAAYGRGTTVVDVITGKKIKL